MYFKITDIYKTKKPEAEIVSGKTETTMDPFFDELNEYNIHLNRPQQEAVFIKCSIIWDLQVLKKVWKRVNVGLDVRLRIKYKKK